MVAYNILNPFTEYKATFFQIKSVILNVEKLTVFFYIIIFFSILTTF